ncbi:MAG: BamA/TamA family outer membrane protein, partial [Syntrophothermus sp.]
MWCFLLEAGSVAAQDSTACYEKDAMDVVFSRKPDLQDTLERITTFFLPYAAYSPTTEFLFGLGGNFSFRLGKKYQTNLSAANASIEVTTEKQIILQLKSNIFLGHNRWFLQGDWRFYLYNIPSFGLGTGRSSPIPCIPQVSEPSDPSSWDDAFRVKYNWLRIHEIITKRVGRDMYFGLGYHLDMHFDIQDLALRMEEGNTVITPHYAYSVQHGFNPDKYTVSGLSLNYVYDTRDNLINPYKGIYVNVNYRDFFTFLGSSQNGSQLWTEFRTYINLEKKMPRHLLAFWLYGAFQVSGEIPYFDLRSTGFDQLNSSGRGYVQGRWRGEHIVYGEVEYRFPISRCSQVLGGALFVNATTASSRDLGTP